MTGLGFVSEIPNLSRCSHVGMAGLGFVSEIPKLSGYSHVEMADLGLSGKSLSCPVALTLKWPAWVCQ